MRPCTGGPLPKRACALTYVRPFGLNRSLFAARSLTARSRSLALARCLAAPFTRSRSLPPLPLPSCCLLDASIIGCMKDVRCIHNMPGFYMYSFGPNFQTRIDSLSDVQKVGPNKWGVEFAQNCKNHKTASSRHGSGGPLFMHGCGST